MVDTQLTPWNATETETTETLALWQIVFKSTRSGDSTTSSPRPMEAFFRLRWHRHACFNLRHKRARLLGSHSAMRVYDTQQWAKRELSAIFDIGIITKVNVWNRREKWDRHWASCLPSSFLVKGANGLFVLCVSCIVAAWDLWYECKQADGKLCFWCLPRGK